MFISCIAVDLRWPLFLLVTRPIVDNGCSYSLLVARHIIACLIYVFPIISHPFFTCLFIYCLVLSRLVITCISSINMYVTHLFVTVFHCLLLVILLLILSLLIVTYQLCNHRKAAEALSSR